MACIELVAVNHEKAERHADRHIELAGGALLAGVAAVMYALGEPEEAPEPVNAAMRVQPYRFDWAPMVKSWSLLRLGRHAEAVEIAAGALASATENSRVHGEAPMALTAAPSLDGDMDEARSRSEEQLVVWPNFAVTGHRRRIHCHADTAWLDRVDAAFLAAGVPEGATAPSDPTQKAE